MATFSDAIYKQIAEKYFNNIVKNHANFIIELCKDVISEKEKEYNEFQMGLFMSKYAELIDRLEKDPFQVLFIEDISIYIHFNSIDIQSHHDFIEQLIESIVLLLVNID